MSDQIVGLAVLQQTATPGIWHLWLRCRRGDGSSFETYLHISDSTTPNVPDRVDGYPVWRFNRVGSKLDCHPSLLCRGSENFKEFHNTYNWQVDYVEMTQPMPSDPNQATVWWQLNDQDAAGADLLTPPQRQAAVAELRRQRVLVP